MGSVDGRQCVPFTVFAVKGVGWDVYGLCCFTVFTVKGVGVGEV